MRSRSIKGFSVIEVIFFLLVGAFLTFGSWYMYQRSSKDEGDGAHNKSSQTSNGSAKAAALKRYSNTEYGLSFRYPAAWGLTEDLQNIGRGHLEGKVSVKSPAGIVVTFAPNMGGKGGDCIRNTSDIPHHTTSCETLEVLSIEQLPATNSSNGSPIYMYHTKYTPAGANAAAEYGIFIENGNAAPTSTGALIGAFPGNSGIINSKVGYVYDYVSGVGNSRPAYFDNPQIHQAADILRSFKLSD